MPRPAILLALAILVSAAPARAQRSADDDAQWQESCRDGWGNDDGQGRHCEIRNFTVTDAGRALQIDGRQNGSIRVVGWNGATVQVTARLQANAGSDAAAEGLLKEVSISTSRGVIRADGPSMSRTAHRNWSVSYVVQVPRRFDLVMDAENGALGVSGVSGKLEMRTTNGSVTLEDVGGDVRARTQNGSLRLQLTGSRWEGSGLDAETQNGSVRIAMPQQYAARLETGTVNGTIRTEFPITMQGRIGRQLTLALGGGGAPVRAVTTNGSVTLSHR